jgi:hypothetical protein
LKSHLINPALSRLKSSFAVAALLILAGGLLLRFSAVALWDDAWFYTRYAAQLLHHGHYRWNAYGESAYGLTAPAYGLQTVVLQALRLLPGLALWLLSAGWGVVVLGFTHRLVPVRADETGRLRGWLSAFFWATVALNAPALLVHFSSGMDTSFAMAYLAAYLLLVHTFESSLSPGKAFLIGIAGGLAWTIRPDLMLFTVGVPLAWIFFPQSAVQRREAYYTLLFTAFCVLLQVWVAMREFGTLLPLAFYAKSFNPYGAAIAAAYRWSGLGQWAFFMACNLLPALAIGAGLWRGGRVWWRFHTIAERVLMLALVAFMLYHLLLVLPVMGYSARFYYPVWPLLLWLGGRSLVFLLRTQPQRAEAMLRYLHPRALALGLGVALLALGGLQAWRGRPAGAKAQWGRMDAASAYHALGRNNWPCLLEFNALPSSLSIASTELGILGALNLDRRIVDLSGLHDAEAASYGFNPDKLIHLQRPDLIYLPQDDYAEMRADLLAHVDFERLYLAYPAAALDAFQGLALRRDSPFFAQMQAIVVRRLQSQ